MIRWGAEYKIIGRNYAVQMTLSEPRGESILYLSDYAMVLMPALLIKTRPEAMVKCGTESCPTGGQG